MDEKDQERQRIPKGLIVLIGPPGAGKSTFAAELIADGQIDRDAVISSDSIAEGLFGPNYDSGRDPEIFGERDGRLRERLARGEVVVADSTNVRPHARKRLLELAREAEVPATALRFRVTLETAVHQDRDRAKHVKEIRRYHTLMAMTASSAFLREEGFQAVFDVPGADQQVTARRAAKRFRIDQ
jgi:predicted kinase